MKYFKKLVGSRIYLSPRVITDESVTKYTEWMNDFNVTDYIGASDGIITFTSEKDYLENVAKESDNRRYDIVDLKTNKLIGTVSLERFKWTSRNATLGIFIGEEEYRGNGYGAEAIKLILEYGFKYLNLHSIKLDLAGFNERAHKCYLKCGFKDTGRSRDEIFVNGRYYDILHMDILSSEFEGDYIKNKNI